jgi:hypothetical protein
MKTLSTDEIECLLGVRPSDAHPLDILGYGYSSDGARRFRAEQPDFLPQIVAHVQSVLRTADIFPRDTDPASAGFRTFIRREGALFTISSLEEVGFSRFQRITTKPQSETSAIREYIRRVANPDYVCIVEAMA